MRPLLIGSALCLAAGSALADTKIVYLEPGDARAATVLYVAAAHLRLDLPDADGRYVLFDAAARTLVDVDPDARTYASLDPDAIGRLAAQLAAAHLEMEGAMADVPPAQRAQVERVLGQAVMGAANPVVTRTRERAKVGGYDCEIARYQIGEERGELCVAASAALGLSASDQRTLGQFTAFADRMAAQAFPAGTGRGARLSELGGVPAGWKHAALPARVARRVSHDTLPTSLFTLPSDYRRAPLAIPPRE